MLPTPSHPSLPRLIGHRGAARLAPENTLAGFRRAHAEGARWVEFDLRLSADEVPIVLHDATLDRTTNGKGPVAAWRWSALRELDAGVEFDARYRGEGLPSLEQALACCQELGLGANLEFKAEEGGADALVAASAAVLKRMPIPVILSAFEAEALEAAARRLPSLARGLLFGEPPADAAARAQALGCASIHVVEHSLHLAAVRDLQRHGASVLAYTVNDARRALILWGWGVSAIFSDDPGLLTAAR